MAYDDLHITDIIPQGQGDYWFPALPINSDREKPFIRPCKVGSTRYLAFFDSASETWHYTTLTNV